MTESFFGGIRLCASELRRGTGSIRCLARPLLAAPFGPSAMCFLRTSQCFGWHDPLFSRAEAAQGSAAVTQGEVGH